MRVFRHDSNPAVDPPSFRRTARQAEAMIALGVAEAIPEGIQLYPPKDYRQDATRFIAALEDWCVVHSSPLPRNNTLGARRLLVTTLQLDTHTA
ncbi:MAG: hypothetical protein L0312_31250 [Acidobacteria bacterium]|nr:hypothetical protein [Acidobacteriota bacterium]